MKAYTDIEQSKKLAEILPLESADMHYHYCFDFDELESIPTITEEDDHFVLFPKDIKCWSLAALLSILPDEITDDNGYKIYIDIRKYDSKCQIAYYTSLNWSDTIATGEYENLVDACVEMILKLHQQKVL